jgi:hypothetical protein
MILKLIQINVSLKRTDTTTISTGAVLELVTTFHKSQIGYQPRIHTSLAKYNAGEPPVSGGCKEIPRKLFKQLTEEEYADLDATAGSLTQVLSYCQELIEALDGIGAGNTSIVLSS